MSYMYRLFRGAVLGLEVQCLKVLGLRLQDHMVVVPGEVQVVVNMTLNPMAMALVFSPTALVDHVLSHVVCLVFFLTLF
jgi:ribosomal protein L18E